MKNYICFSKAATTYIYLRSKYFLTITNDSESFAASYGTSSKARNFIFLTCRNGRIGSLIFAEPPDFQMIPQKVSWTGIVERSTMAISIFWTARFFRRVLGSIQRLPSPPMPCEWWMAFDSPILDVTI